MSGTAAGFPPGETAGELDGTRPGAAALSRVLQRLLDAAVVLLAIIYLAQFLLILAERGRAREPAPLLHVAAEALAQSLRYLADHPTTYLWQKVDTPAFTLVRTTFANSAVLLLAALAIAGLSGWLLGMLMARSRGRAGSVVALILSILGTSTPSFLLAMFLWVINIHIHQRFSVTALPPTGFGWDRHLIMPALVLAARPLAQIAQVTYVQMSEALRQDFIRTAQAKGLSQRQVHNQHAIPNVLAPVLTTLGASLRFALSSLPVVEAFFLWPGVGLLLLEAIRLGNATLVTDLLVALGLFFLLVNLVLEIITPFLDPRLRNTTQDAPQTGTFRLRETLSGARDALGATVRRLRAALPGHSSPRPDSSALPPLPHSAGSQNLLDTELPASPSAVRRSLGGLLGNLPLLVGGALVLGVVFLAIFGLRLTDASPYQIHGVMMIDGEIGAPPYPPSSVFPWGTDHIGRDVRALVLAGARQTLLLAFFGMAARLALGATLGALAGWWCGSRLDRLVMGATTVWAAFPTTIFALLLIQGLGIQQGMWVFVVALCVVGWGEVAQVVRQHVIGIKPQPFIEAARSVGAQTSRILTQHAMPSLLPILIVLAALEMGGILMLLAELGFLNVFLGGGFRVEIGQAGRMEAVIAYFSDVPEWGAMLSNIRNWWRSYPWMVWYAGVAFFLAILGFNLLGEGLRRFFEHSRVNLGRLFGRYALVGTVATVMLLAWTLRNATPLAQYQAQARAFDAQRVMTDAEELASPAYGGRETGTPGAEQAARYIASRMEEIGLSPAGDLTPTKEKNSFIQTLISPRPHLTGIPVLAQLDATGAVQERFIYRQDFVERTSDAALIAEGPVVGVVLGPEPASTTGDPYGLGRQANLLDAVLIVPEAMAARLQTSIASAVLVVTDDPARWEKKSLFTAATAGRSLRGLTAQSGRGQSSAYISRSTAERLLATTGTSWASLETAGAQLGVGQAGITDPGAAVRLEMPLEFNDELDEETYNVIGFIPGTGAVVEEGGTAMDSQVIMVSAYYDGIGTGPDGTLYPGANDNASGVATMLEIARILKESHYAPKRTIVFVAWTGGERSEGLSVTNIMNAKIGFSGLTVESVVELSGTGAGDGDQIAIGEGSSYRLTQLFQKAAGRLNIPTTTRGRGPHHGLEAAPGFGGRDALTLHLSWDGSDRTAHTPADTPATLSLDRLRRFGQAALLTISVMGREPVY